MDNQPISVSDEYGEPTEYYKQQFAPIWKQYKIFRLISIPLGIGILILFTISFLFRPDPSEYIFQFIFSTPGIYYIIALVLLGIIQFYYDNWKVRCPKCNGQILSGGISREIRFWREGICDDCGINIKRTTKHNDVMNYSATLSPLTDEHDKYSFNELLSFTSKEDKKSVRYVRFAKIWKRFRLVWYVALPINTLFIIIVHYISKYNEAILSKYNIIIGIFLLAYFPLLIYAIFLHQDLLCPACGTRIFGKARFLNKYKSFDKEFVFHGICPKCKEKIK